MRGEIIGYFRDIFKAADAVKMGEMLDCVDPCITDHMAAELQKPFIKDEILDAVHQMCQTKTSSLDGVLVLFYQKFGNCEF